MTIVTLSYATNISQYNYALLLFIRIQYVECRW